MYVCSGFPVNLWFLRFCGKDVLNRHGYGSPLPTRCLLKRGLVYHLGSRLNNMSVNGVSTAPAYLLLAEQIAPSLGPALPRAAPPPREPRCE